ncbi:hypothetical protein [Phenylobacterium sp.]|uniref:hypothetical protein n=1 Tax=Phenylobacterium sp. TaxID=1871053 RepID=UPI002ED78386
MPSKYTLIQYRPDRGSDERLNIGVIAWDADGAHVVFLESWERARLFGGQDVAFLREFAQSMERRLPEEIELLAGELTDELVERWLGDVAHSVQLTPAQGAPEGAKKLVASLAARFLYSPPPRAKKGRYRRAAVSHAYRIIKAAVGAKASKGAKPQVHLHRPLEGKFGEHLFDLVLSDGKPLAGVAAISFEVRSRARLQSEVDAVAWALDDVHRLDKGMPLAVFVRPPTNPEAEQVFLAASKTFNGLGAKVMQDDAALARWATRQAGRPRTAGAPKPPANQQPRRARSAASKHPPPG